jgi:hypothetical protein
MNGELVRIWNGAFEICLKTVLLSGYPEKRQRINEHPQWEQHGNPVRSQIGYVRNARLKSLTLGLSYSVHHGNILPN